MIADAGIVTPDLADILDELRGKNFIRVTKYAAVSRPGSRTIHRRVLDELSREVTPNLPSLFLHDSLRILAGKKPIYMPEAIRRLGGELVDVAPNLRTNVGIDFCAAVLGGTQVAQADYIALSNNTDSPSATDTSSTLPWSTANATDAAAAGTRGEYTALGLARKQATYAHTTGVTSYSQTATWTATSAITSVQLAGLFGGAGKTAQGSGGTNILFLESTFTPTSMVSADQVSLAWTVNI